jgi:hypothetical protein
MSTGIRNRPWSLLVLPIATYAVSYGYLAWYHGRVLLANTVIHENGRYTLAETTFYAPHFLGHILVLVTVALLMVGSYSSLTAVLPSVSARTALRAAGALTVLLAASTVLAIGHWGAAETWEFVSQLRQRPDLLEPGGSWLLHLPSTLSLFAGTPLFVLAVLWFFDRPAATRADGRIAFGLAAVLVVAVTWVVVPRPVATAALVLRDPRYLAHGVRELVTFALIYFPLPLAFWLSRSPEQRGFRWSRSLVLTVVVLGAVFTGALAYQVLVPLERGVSELAQHPDFAPDGMLSIPYLLASHFFEHFLDSLFFALLCVLILSPRPDTRR